MKRFLMNLLHAIANTADNLASKLATNEPQPLLDYEKRGYEPAGIIHYGEWHLTIGGTYYEVYNQPDGSAEVWANGEYLTNYPTWETAYESATRHAHNHHAKDQK